jgi:hypothetical protein
VPRDIFRLSATMVLASFFVTNVAEAQDTPQTSQALVSDLLDLGYEVKAMSFLNDAIVLFLQRGDTAYICETDQNGQSRLCLLIQ